MLSNTRAGQGQAYEYLPLPTTTSIRLLQISTSLDIKLSCSLHATELRDNPFYDALSYTWGDPLYHGFTPPESRNTTSSDRSIPLPCDGAVLMVTANLYDALLEFAAQLRRRSAANPGGFSHREIGVHLDRCYLY
jgi:hypothetical protein